MDALNRRIKSLDGGEILEHLDTTVSLVNLQTQGYRKTRNNDYLKEMALSAQAVYVMAEALMERSGEGGTAPPPARQITPQARQVKSARPY